MNRPKLETEPTKDFSPGMVVAEPSPADDDALLQALAALPESCRDVIFWFHRDQDSYEAIAARLGLPTETVRQLYRHAIAMTARELHHLSEAAANENANARTSR